MQDEASGSLRNPLKTCLVSVQERRGGLPFPPDLLHLYSRSNVTLLNRLLLK